MEKLLQQLINKRSIVLFLTVIVAIVGIYSYYILPKQESPDLDVPVALIITPYPGANASDVKELVTKKIEDELSEIDNVDYMQSYSQDSASVVTIMFEGDIDAETAMQQVRNKIADVKNDLPSGCQDSIIKTDLTETAGIIISLSGDNYTYEQLASFGEQFKSELSDIDGISKFNIDGDLDKEVKINVDVAKLNQLGLSFEDLSQLIQTQNLEIPSGFLDTSTGKIKVSTPGIFTSIQDIRDMVIMISSDTGVVTRLSDVADVYMDVEEGVEKYKQNGINAVLLTGYFEKSKNVVIVGEEVREAIDRVKAQLPEDLLIEEIVYQPEAVSKSVNDFMSNLLGGIILVIVVIFLGMGIRNAIVVSTAIPLSILMTFCVMYFMKIPIHQMSLTALIISLGILVDNAIVVTDTVQVRIDGGEDKKTASIKGATMSAVPIFAATLTTIAAFSPLMGMPGAAGMFLGAVPMVLIISIIAAYIVSMVITPAMTSSFLKKTKPKAKQRKGLRSLFEAILKVALKGKILVSLIMVVVLVVVIVGIVPLLKSELFPYADKDLFYIDINSERMGDIEATEELSDEVVSLLSKEPEITSYTVAVGTGLPKFFVTMPPATPAQDYAQMVCKYDLGDKETRRFNSKVEFANYIQKLLDENISGGIVSVNLLQNAEPGAKIKIQVSGDNLDNLQEVANQLVGGIETIPGTTGVEHNFKDKTFQYMINVDNDKAISLGITKYDIQRQINIALYGTEASVFRRDGKEYTLLLNSDIDSIALLENIAIKSSMTSQKVPLKQFATVSYGKKVDSIYSYNGEMTIMVESNVLPEYDVVTVTNQIENDVLPTVDTLDTKITFDGEREMISDNFGIVLLLAIAAIFIIYLILLIQFGSFIQPIVILVTVPLSLIGSFLGLWLFKQPLSFTGFLGIIALIGLVVKNGILLIEYINMAREQGHSIDESCIDAVDKRYNAIMLSAITTVMGLFPLAISGSELFAPMAVALMSGLIASTFLTMIVIPVIYSLVETRIYKSKNRKSNKKSQVTV